MADDELFLRLSKKESQALVSWFMFQENSNIEDGEFSTIHIDEVKLLNKIKNCVQKMTDEPSKYVAMKLSPEYCKIVYDWYSNLPEIFIDDIDVDVHASLGMFLIECDKNNKE